MTGPARILTPAQEAELAVRYPNEPNAALALEFGVAVKFLTAKAGREGWKKSAERIKERGRENHAKRPPVASPVKERVFDLVKARRTEGATLTAVRLALDMTKDNVWCHLCRLVGEGKLFRIETRPAVYFADPVWAREYITSRSREQVAAAQATQARRRADEASDRAKVHARPVAAPRASFRMQEAITPAGVKVTRVVTPGHDPRYQVCPGAEVPRLFSAAPPGVNPVTGLGWGSAA